MSIAQIYSYVKVRMSVFESFSKLDKMIVLADAVLFGYGIAKAVQYPEGDFSLVSVILL